MGVTMDRWSEALIEPVVELVTIACIGDRALSREERARLRARLEPRFEGGVPEGRFERAAVAAMLGLESEGRAARIAAAAARVPADRELREQVLALAADAARADGLVQLEEEALRGIADALAIPDRLEPLLARLLRP